MSELVTNKITPATGSSDTVTLGDSGDTFTIPAGVTLAGSGASLTALPAANLTGTAAVANGGTGVTAVGTSGNVLTSTGSAWASTAIPAGGGWQFVSSATASDSATLAFTNMAAGYDYQYIMDLVVSANNQVGFDAELGVAGPTYRTSSYRTTSVNINNAGNSASHETTAHIVIISVSGEALGTQADEALYYGELNIMNPAGTANKTGWIVRAVLDGSHPALEPSYGGGYYDGSAEAHTSIRFACSAGNIASGTIFQYRRIRS